MGPRAGARLARAVAALRVGGGRHGLVAVAVMAVADWSVLVLEATTNSAVRSGHVISRAGRWTPFPLATQLERPLAVRGRLFGQVCGSDLSVLMHERTVRVVRAADEPARWHCGPTAVRARPTGDHAGSATPRLARAVRGTRLDCQEIYTGQSCARSVRGNTTSSRMSPIATAAGWRRGRR